MKKGNSIDSIFIGSNSKKHFMISQETKKLIISIWDKYIAVHKKVVDSKGVEFENINEKRISSIVNLKKIIQNFNAGTIDVNEFKTNIDSFNKQNNYWGFTSIKGQMFFNGRVYETLGIAGFVLNHRLKS